MADALPTELESLDELLAEGQSGSLESGTRRVAKAEEAPPDGEDGRRDSQRPTFRVPSSAGLARYIDTPPRIDSADLSLSEESLAEMFATLESEAPTETLQPIPEPPTPEATMAEPDVFVRSTDRTTLLPPRAPPSDDAPVSLPLAMPIPRNKTLRIRLTPYAREHAVADGDTDDTPAEMLHYLKLLGSFDRLPYVAASMQEVMLAKLDHKEGFVLSLVDGASDIDTILDACPMPTHKTLRILYELYVRGVLGLR